MRIKISIYKEYLLVSCRFASFDGINERMLVIPIVRNQIIIYAYLLNDGYDTI